MAIYNPDTPILFLQGEINSISIVSRYEHDDDTGLGPSGLHSPMSFRIEASFKPVTTGSAATREAYTYSSLDIKTGDWIADTTGNTCLKITSIISFDTYKSDEIITFIAEDVDAYVQKTYRTNVLSSGDAICAFEMSDSGEAIIAGNSNYFFKSNVGAVDKIQARFQVKEKSESYRLKFDTPQTLIEVGDVVTVNSSGDLVPINSQGANAYKLGYVVSKTYNDTVVYIKPFNQIIDDFTAPERLKGSVGDVYYASTSAYGDLTTNPSAGNNEMFLHFKDAIPTVIQADIVNVGMVEGDSLVINDVNIFAPLGAGVTKTSTEIKNEVNLTTLSHHVTASIYLPNAENYSGKVTQPVNGDVMIVFAPVGQAGSQLPSVGISDGTNSITYSPGYNTDTIYNAGGGVQYNTFSANIIAQDLNQLFTAGNVDIVASTFVWDQANFKSQYPGLMLTSGAGKDVVITGDSSFADYTGATFTEALGLEVNVTTKNISYLNFTRSDGGDILLQGEGSFVNSNGIVSSSSGTPALLLMIEDELIGAQGPIGPQGDKGQKGDQGIKGDVGPQGPQGDKGDKGQKGDQGIKGDVGPQGLKGDNGQKGEIGAQGSQGIQGEKGQKGEIGAQGAQGIQGPQGAQGLQGIDGPQGAQGQKGEAGAQGLQGIDGPQGTQGQKGEVGAQGLQGIDGPQGAQGLQGIDGPQGAQGQKGEVGAQGLQGIDGPQGAQGLQGIDGPQGAQGQKGEVGAQGLQGIDGPQGTQGQKGEVGAQGLQGIDGPQGTQGQKGEVGAQGLQGIDGPQGAQGQKGEVGAQGLQGIDGPQGAQGLQGIDGPQGAQGNKGQKGEVGAQGLQGIDGPQGTQGQKGEVGAQGLQGIDGPQGAQGQKGEVGAQGLQGIDGPQGAQGNKGQKGEVGAQGLQGIDGPQGTQGQKGEVGAQGLQGIDGPQGAQGQKGEVGAQGLQGIDGPQGTQGQKGEVGAQGLQGIDGPQGTQGQKGEVGAQGLQGIDGPQGAQGQKGEVGAQGLQGIDGPQGAQGQKGEVGAQGLQGIDGPQGTQGQKGEVGAQGLQGIDGPQGAQGQKGEVGAQGLQGIDGPQGAQGLQGIDGPQGAQGQKGEVGAQGLQGIDGPQGAQGNKGQKGEVGAQGLQGIDGPQGAQGQKGEVGAQGLQGIDGPQGAQGIKGDVGPQGAQGNVGPQGAQGNAGSDANALADSDQTLSGDRGITLDGNQLTIQDSTSLNQEVLILNSDGGITVGSGSGQSAAFIQLRENSGNGANYIELSAPASLSANAEFTLPSSDGTSGQVIQTNGSGQLSFVDKDSGPQGPAGPQGAQGADGSKGQKGEKGQKGLLNLTGSTPDGLITFISGSNANVESNLTFGALGLNVNGDLSANDIKVKTHKTGTISSGHFYPGTRTAHNFTANFTVVAGQLYQFKSGGGNATWGTARADSEANARGLLAVATTATTSQEMVLDGVVKAGNNLTGGQPGDIVYVSTTAGQFTLTAPSGSGDIVRIVGYLIKPSESLLYFRPSDDWVELT